MNKLWAGVAVATLSIIASVVLLLHPVSIRGGLPRGYLNVTCTIANSSALHVVAINKGVTADELLSVAIWYLLPNRSASATVRPYNMSPDVVGATIRPGALLTFNLQLPPNITSALTGSAKPLLAVSILAKDVSTGNLADYVSLCKT